jgi:hypothetical protein
MPEVSPQKYPLILRAVLLTGVLAGLLFSCGEGIRLFPFPPEATLHKYSEWKSGAALNYQKNIHRPESRQGNQAAKIQRHNQPHFWTNGYHAPNAAPLLASVIRRETDVLFNPGFFKSRLFSFSGASRAPPLRS